MAVVAVSDDTRGRAWLALSLATVPLTVSFWAIVVAFVSGSGMTAGGSGGVQIGGAAALGAALSAPTLAVVAVGSGHRYALWAVTGGIMAGFSGGVMVLAVTGDVVTGLVAGFGLAITAALRRPPEASYRRRLVAVGVATLLAFVATHTVTLLALASGPALAVLAVGLADETIRPHRSPPHHPRPPHQL